MTEWREVKLGDVCRFQNGFAFKSSLFINDGNINVIKIKEIKDGKIVFLNTSASVKNDQIYKKYQANNGDVLIALTGDPVARTNPASWVGRVAIYREYYPSLINQRVAKFLPDTAILYPNFVYYFFREFNNFFNLAKKATGSASQANISTNTLMETRILLPPLDVQKKIAGVLGALDDKIELNNKINQNLEAQAQALFKSWFIDFEPFGGKMPNDWKIGKLGDIAEIIMGQSPDGSTYNEEKKGIPFFQGRAEFSFRYPSLRLFTTLPKRTAKKGDILMSVRAPVGDLNVALFECCIGRGLSAIREKNLRQSFLYYLLNFEKKQLNVFNGEGTVFGAINKNGLRDLAIIIPISKHIDHFEKIVTPIDAQIETLSQENVRLTELRDTLLPKLMNGEIDVDNVKID